MLYFILPLKIERRFERFPWATVTLIVVNTVIFFLSVMNLPEIVDMLGFKPNVHGTYTWLTSMFLHGGLFHLIGNMYFLWLFGSVVEDAIGWVRYLLIYFAGGIAAVLAHSIITALSSPEAMAIPLVGASGAIAAIIAIAGIRFSKAKLKIGYFVWVFIIIRAGSFAVSALVGVALYVVQELLYAFLSLSAPTQTAHWAHIGGLVFGGVAALTFGFIKDAADEYLSEEARGYAASGANEIAAAKYEELAERQPENPDVLVQKVQASIMTPNGDAVAEARDLTKAIELLSRSGRIPEAVDAYNLLSQSPHRRLSLDTATELKVASMAESQRDYLSALKIYNRLATQMAGTPAAEKACFRVPHVLLNQGKVEDARTWWGYFQSTYPSSQWTQHADTAFTAE